MRETETDSPKKILPNTMGTDLQNSPEMALTNEQTC